MKTIQMQILLPHLIAIPDGEYEVYAARHIRTIQLSRPTQIVYETELGKASFLCGEQTLVSMDSSTDVDLTNIQNVENEFSRCVNITLTTANRLIDWYRVQTGRHHITQLVLPQIEFARLIDIGPTTNVLTVYRYERPKPVDEPLSDDEVQTLRQNFIKRQPPPLTNRLLLDARNEVERRSGFSEEAFSQHRYKECILVCWSAIESIFDPLIRAKLKERLPDIGFDIGQAGWNIERALWFFTRLDVLPRLLTDFSFKELPDDFWARLQRSRNVRNQVVHEGEDVEEDDAANTLGVTREFVYAVKAFRDSIIL